MGSDDEEQQNVGYWKELETKLYKELQEQIDLSAEVYEELHFERDKNDTHEAMRREHQSQTEQVDSSSGIYEELRVQREKTEMQELWIEREKNKAQKSSATQEELQLQIDSLSKVYEELRVEREKNDRHELQIEQQKNEMHEELRIEREKAEMQELCIECERSKTQEASEVRKNLQVQIDLSSKLHQELCLERERNEMLDDLGIYKELQEQIELSSEVDQELQIERKEKYTQEECAESQFAALRAELRSAQQALAAQEAASGLSGSQELQDLDIVADESVGMLGCGIANIPPKVPIVRWVKGNTWASRMSVRPGHALVRVNALNVGDMNAKQYLQMMQSRPVRLKFSKLASLGEQVRVQATVISALKGLSSKVDT